MSVKIASAPEDLLIIFSQATQDCSDPDEQFLYTETKDGARVRHAGLPGGEIEVNPRHIEALFSAGKIVHDGSPAGKSNFAFKIS